MEVHLLDLDKEVLFLLLLCKHRHIIDYYETKAAAKSLF